MKPAESMARVLKWATPSVVVVQAVLVATGVLELGSAIRIALLIEAVLLIAAVVLALTARGTYRRMRAEGAARGAALYAAARRSLPGPVVAITRHELRVLRTLWLAVRRRDDVPPGATAFSYGASQAPVFYALVAVSLVEIGVVHWLLPWAWARMILGLLGLYGAVWLIGFHQTFQRRPHYAHRGHLVLRCGYLGEIAVALEDIAGARKDFRSWRSRSFALHENVDGAPAVSLTPSGMTDVALHLTPDATVRVGTRTLTGPVIHVTCDDPAELLDHLDAHRTRSRPAPGG